MNIFLILLKIIFFIIIFITILFIISLILKKQIHKYKQINNIVDRLFEICVKCLSFLYISLIITGMMKSCVGRNTTKKTTYTYKKNKIEDQVIDKLKKSQAEKIENSRKVDITLTTVKNNLETFLKRYKINDSTITTSRLYKKSGTGREEFCVAKKTCYYITYELKTEKVLLLQMTFKYPETKKQIDDFRNHICLFLGMTKPNVNFNDVDNLVTGHNIMFKMTTNIITRNYIYENYKYYLYYNEDDDLLIITVKGVAP